MIRHQTISPYVRSVFLAVVCQSVEIESPVFAVEEDLRSIVPTLSDVVGVIYSNNPGNS